MPISKSEAAADAPQVDPPPDNRDAPMIWPSGASRTTATSCPSGKCSSIFRGAPDHWPTARIDRTTFDSGNVRPPFSPRPIAVTCSWSKPIRSTLALPTPEPILMETPPPALVTPTSATVWLLPFRLLDCRADIAPVRSDQTDGAVNHDLRRIGAITEAVTIAILSRGGGFKREGVLPAEIVPVGHVKGERQDIGPALGEFVQISVCRRTG